MRIIEEGYCVYTEPWDENVPLRRCFFGTRTDSYYTSVFQAQRTADRCNRTSDKLKYTVRKVALVDMEDE